MNRVLKCRAASAAGPGSPHTSDSSTDEHNGESAACGDTALPLDQTTAAAAAAAAAAAGGCADDSGLLGGSASCSIATGPSGMAAAAAAVAGSGSDGVDAAALAAAAAAAAATACKPNRPPHLITDQQQQQQQQMGGAAAALRAQPGGYVQLLVDTQIGHSGQTAVTLPGYTWDGAAAAAATAAGVGCGSDSGWVASPQQLGGSRARISDSSSRQTPQSWPVLKSAGSMLSSEVSSCSNGSGPLRGPPAVSAPVLGQQAAAHGMTAGVPGGPAADAVAVGVGVSPAAFRAAAAAAAAGTGSIGPLQHWAQPGSMQLHQQQQDNSRSQSAAAAAAAAPGGVWDSTAAAGAAGHSVPPAGHQTIHRGAADSWLGQARSGLAAQARGTAAVQPLDCAPAAAAAAAAACAAGSNAGLAAHSPGGVSAGYSSSSNGQQHIGEGSFGAAAAGGGGGAGAGAVCATDMSICEPLQGRLHEAANFGAACQGSGAQLAPPVLHRASGGSGGRSGSQTLPPVFEMPRSSSQMVCSPRAGAARSSAALAAAAAGSGALEGNHVPTAAGAAADGASGGSQLGLGLPGGLSAGRRSISLPANFVAQLPEQDSLDDRLSGLPACHPAQQQQQQRLLRRSASGMPQVAGGGGSSSIHPGALPGAHASSGSEAMMSLQPGYNAPAWQQSPGSGYPGTGWLPGHAPDRLAHKDTGGKPVQQQYGAPGHMGAYGSSGSMSSSSGQYACSGPEGFLAGNPAAPGPCASYMGPPPSGYGPPEGPPMGSYGYPSGYPCGPRGTAVMRDRGYEPPLYAPPYGPPPPCDCWECRMAIMSGRVPPSALPPPGFSGPPAPGFSAPPGPGYSVPPGPGFSGRPGYSAPPVNYGPPPGGPGFSGGPVNPAHEPLLGDLPLSCPDAEPYYLPSRFGSLPGPGPGPGPAVGGPGPLRTRSLPPGVFGPGPLGPNLGSSRAHPYEGSFTPVQRSSSSAARLAAGGGLRRESGSGGYPGPDSLAGQPGSMWPPPKMAGNAAHAAGAPEGGLQRTSSMGKASADAAANLAAAEGAAGASWQPPNALGRTVSAPSSTMRQAVDEALGPIGTLPMQHRAPVQRSRSGRAEANASSILQQLPEQYSSYPGSNSHPVTPVAGAGAQHSFAASGGEPVGRMGPMGSGSMAIARRASNEGSRAPPAAVAGLEAMGYGLYGGRGHVHSGYEGGSYRASMDDCWQQQQQQQQQPVRQGPFMPQPGLTRSSSLGLPHAGAAVPPHLLPEHFAQQQQHEELLPPQQPLHGQQDRSHQGYAAAQPSLPPFHLAQQQQQGSSREYPGSSSAPDGHQQQQMRQGPVLPVLEGTVVGTAPVLKPRGAAAAAEAPAGDELVMALDSNTSFGDFADVLLADLGQEPLSLADIDKLLTPMDVEADLLDMK